MGHVDRPPDLVEELRSMKAQIHELQQRVRAAAFLSPVIAVLEGGSVSLTSGAGANLSFSGAIVDTAGMWSALLPDRLTVPRAGVYVVSANLSITADGAGVGIRSAAIIASTSPTTSAGFLLLPPPNNGFEVAPSLIVTLEEGDTIQVSMFQNSGGTQTGAGTLSAVWQGYSA